MIGRVQPAAAVLDQTGRLASLVRPTTRPSGTRTSRRTATRRAITCGAGASSSTTRSAIRSHYLSRGDDGRVAGGLPLVQFRSRMFGAFAVSLPFVNYGGVVADDDETAAHSWPRP